MPDIRTVIRQLYYSQIAGVSKSFAAATDQGTISVGFAIRNFSLTGSTDIVMTVGGAVPSRLTFTPMGVGANAIYLKFDDDMSTVADLTRTHRTVLGGDYGGCLYSVYDAGGGIYKCVHTPRSAGVNLEQKVGLLQQYARAQRWRLVHALPSRGFIGQNRVDGVYFVTRVSYTIADGPVVRTARLQLNSLGGILVCDRWHDGVMNP